MVTPQHKTDALDSIIRGPVETWSKKLVNDFEMPVFNQHPVLGEIKQKLLDLGAVYAAMTGSGSALFGIFPNESSLPVKDQFEDCFFWSSKNQQVLFRGNL